VADISYSINVNVAAGALQQNLNAANITSNFSTTGVLALTLELGTATTAINTASLTQVGLTYARSLATTNTHTVSFGRLSGTTLHETVSLKAGDAALLRLAPGDYAAKAAVENTRLLVQIFED
jgi:hypothetical protein